MWKYSEELYHHGIIGMKWGVRRYQNKDGSLTSAGKKRAAKLENDYKSLTGRNLKKKVKSDNSQNKPKTINDMSDNELKAKTNRMTLENNYLSAKRISDSYNAAQVSRGQKIVSSIGKKVIIPAATESGKQILIDWLTRNGKKIAKRFDIED